MEPKKQLTFGKSKKSALFLGAITVLSFAITDAILNLLIPYWLTGDIHQIIAQPENLQQPGSLLGLLIFIFFILAIMIGVAAFWLFRFFGEAYYGKGSAPRWALFGFLFAVFLKLPEWIFSENLWPLRAALQLIGLFVAFFLARKFMPVHKSS